MDTKIREHEFITPEVMAWLDYESAPMPLPEPISASDVRRYVAATGDDNPIYTDEASARAAGYRTCLIPPFLLVDLPMRVGGGFGNDFRYQVPLPEHYNDTRNGGNEATFLAPAYVGDQLSVTESMDDIYVREGRAGLGVWMTKLIRMTNQLGEVVLEARQSSVRLPGGPKGPKD